MNPDLRDNSWIRGGTSLIWDADALNRICPAESVRSLRELLRLYQSGWPEDALKLINGRTLVIAGLEAAMDTLFHLIRDEIKTRIEASLADLIPAGKP